MPQLNVLKAKPSLPSTLRLRPVVTANILAGSDMLNRQLGLLLIREAAKKKKPVFFGRSLPNMGGWGG